MIGYVAFVLLLFLPGLAVGLVTRLFENKRFVEGLALSFGLSLVVTPIALVVGYAIFREVSSAIAYGVLALGAVVSLAGLLLKRRPVKWPSINTLELLALIVVPVQGLLFVLQFAKYPIVPQVSVDFQYHLEIALQINTGKFSFATATYPPAVHFLIASLLSLQQGISLALMQYGVAIIGTFAPLLVFVVVSKILGDQRLGLAASFFWVFSGTFWYFTLFTSGLLANFLADIVTLMVVYLIAEGVESLDFRRALLILAGGTALYLSHYTVIVFVAALWLMLPFVWLRMRESFSGYFKICGLVALPGVVIVLARPHLVTVLLGISSLSGPDAGGGIYPSGPVATFLASISPFLANLYVDVGIGLFVLTLFAILSAFYATAKKNGIWVPVMLVWFVLTWIATPNSSIAWRYSYLAVLPLVVLWPAALRFILPKAVAKVPAASDVLRRKKVFDKSEASLRLTLFCVIALILLYGAPIGSITQNLTSGSGATSQNQEQVFQAMQWVGNRTKAGTGVLGLEDWEFSYLEPIWGIDVSVFLANTTASSAASYASKTGERYVLVSYYLVTGTSASIEGTNPNFYEFENYSGFSLVYHNPSVAVYLVEPKAG